MKQYGMGGAYSKHFNNEKGKTFSYENMNKLDYLRELGVDDITILKCTLHKCVCSRWAPETTFCEPDNESLGSMKTVYL